MALLIPRHLQPYVLMCCVLQDQVFFGQGISTLCTQDCTPLGSIDKKHCFLVLHTTVYCTPLLDTGKERRKSSLGHAACKAACTAAAAATKTKQQQLLTQEKSQSKKGQKIYFIRSTQLSQTINPSKCYIQM